MGRLKKSVKRLRRIRVREPYEVSRGKARWRVLTLHPLGDEPRDRVVAKYFVTKEEADQYVKAQRGAAAGTMPAVRSAALVYFIQSDTGLIKIGHAVDVHARLRSLQIGSPARLTLLATIVGGVAMEARLHRRFGADRVHGEWFKPSPRLLAYIETKATPAPR